MAILTGMMRLGRDAELRTTQGGEHVANLALAYNYGQKASDGKKPTTWVEASLWGKRAESLSQYLLKGQMLSVVLSDVHVRTFEKRDGGTGYTLSGRVMDLEFAGKPPEAKPAPKPAPKAEPAGGFVDDDIPF